jgi:magnesium chelatase family protein
MARRNGLRGAIVPDANAAEAALVEGVVVYPVASLPQAVELAAAEDRPSPPRPAPSAPAASALPDMTDVRGQDLARRALEIAAAGGHNLLFVGPPGSGKTMLALRLPGLLPRLSLEEALETSAIHSAAGARLDVLLAARPFRAPHHTASDVAIVGGGTLPRPGEVSLAHNGVLFLDELPEFPRNVLEALRQPLEERTVTIARARGTLRLPARFQLIAAMNPCPCGRAGQRHEGCRCTPAQVERYRRRVSGPLLDRIDLQVEVGAVGYAEMTGPSGEASGAVRRRVLEARARQDARRGATGVVVNAELDSQALREVAQVDAGGAALLEAAMRRLALSGRAYDRIRRVARTLADLDGGGPVAAAHIAEALHFRGASPD